MPRLLKISITRRLVTLICCLILIAPTSGCGDPIGKTVNALQSAIGQLQDAPATYQTVLGNTLADLKDGVATARDQVQALMNRLVVESEQMVFCVSDYFGKRAEEDLEAILHAVKPDKPAPTVSPTVCKTDPSDQVTAGQTAKVVFSGYDLPSFASPSRPDARYSASIFYGDTEALKDFGSVSYTSGYQVVVAFQPNATKALDASKNPRLVLQWSGGKVGSEGGSSSLPVVFPPDPIRAVLHKEVQYHVLSGLTQNCEKLRDATHTDYWAETMPGGWKIDTSQGDAGHSGIHKGPDASNKTAKRFNSDWAYYAVGDSEVRFTGTVCADAVWGAGGIYDIQYDIYTIQR